MQIQDRYLDAVTTVLDWDFPDEAYPEAVNAQALLLARLDSNDYGDFDVDVTVH